MVTTAPKGLAPATPEQSGITLLQEKGVVNFQLGSATGVAAPLANLRRGEQASVLPAGPLSRPRPGLESSVHPGVNAV